MKKHLPIIKKAITKSRRLFSAVMLLLVLLGITKSTQAQVYYLINSTTGNTTNAANALKKVDYNGSNDGNVTTGIPNPILAEVDAPNNRVFTYNGFLGNRVINVVNMSTGGVTNTITLPAGIQVSGPSVTAIKYDPINDWVYYVTNSNGGSATLNAVYRSKPDGSQNAALATGIATLPQWLALDIPNNRVFIYEGVFSGRKILTFDLGSNTVTGNAPVSNIANAIAYDPITDYLYYITSDNDQINAGTTNDALRKIRPGGSGGEIVIKSSLVKSPQYMALDAGNNRAFVYNGYYGSSTTIRLDDTGIYSVDLTTGATTRILDHSGLQNTPNYLRVYALFAPARPNVSTTAVSTFSSASATLGGNVTRSDAAVTARGVVYSSSNTTPTIGGSGVTQASIGTGTGSFSQSISGLSAATTYYVRAYATSGAGTTYGAVTTFLTLSDDATLSGLSISAGSLTPGFSSGTISYTASVANANSTITVTPIKNNANATIKVNNVTVASGSASGAISLNIGDNIITTVVTAQDGTTTKTYTLTVNRPKASQTITFNTLPTKTFGDGDFAPGASASSGLTVSYSSDNTGVATIVSGQIHIVGAGTANITASQGGDANNLAATNATQTLTVNKASQTITFNTLPAKTYGDGDFAPGATASSGLTVSYSSDNTAVATIVSNQIHIVGQGTANITASQAGDANRLAASSVAQSLTVNKATVTITAVAKTKVYGDSDPAFTYNATGVVGSDAPTGALTRDAGINIGTYAINQGTLSYGGNYNLTYIGANLTITKRPITVLPVAKTKIYGDPDPFLNQFTITAGSLAPSDATADQFGRAAGESVGTYLMTLGTKKFYSGGSIEVTANYDVTVQPAYFTITAKPVIVTASVQTKTYGDPDPSLTYSYSSLAFSDTFTGSLTRDTGEGFGTYAITQGTLALSSNYTLSFTGNNLTISKKTINVTAIAASKTYGDTDPAFGYSNDALAFSDSFTGALSRDPGENVGTYAITLGSLAVNNNYIFNYTGANLSIGKATLTYVATPASRPFQTANPTFTGSVTGFVSGDSQVSATAGTLSFTSTATVNSAIGSYPILGSGLSATNYDFVQASANSTALTITQSNDATLAGLTVDQGTLNPVFSSSQEAYSINVAHEVASLNLSATVNQQNASIKVNGAALTSGDSKNIVLPTGPSTINIAVTAQDGITTKNYTIDVSKAYSSNNLLASISLSGITYSPAFDANTLSYTATVGNLVTSTNVGATAAAIETSIFVNGNNVTESGPVNFQLQVGNNPIAIISKAENGAEKTYTVNVTREAPAALSNVTKAAIVFDPATTFVATTGAASANFLTYVSADISSVRIKVTALQENAVIRINGNIVTTATFSDPISLNAGPTLINVNVTAQDGVTVKTYSFNVIRTGSNYAKASIVFDPASTFAATTGTADDNYMTSVSPDLSSIRVKVTALQANAEVRVNGNIVTSGVFTDPIALNIGATVINVKVTAQDGVTVYTYSYTVNRTGSNYAKATIVFDPASTFVATTGTANANFITSVSPDVSSIRIKATAIQADAEVRINDNIVTSGIFSDPIPLNVGATVINVKVTAQDGVTVYTYSYTVNRAGSSYAKAAIVFDPISTFVATTGTADVNYMTSVSSDVSSVRIKATAIQADAVIRINGNIVTSGVFTDPIALNDGPTVINVNVTAQDGVTVYTYSFTVNRTGSNYAKASIVFSPVSTLTSTTGTANANFITSVSPGVSSVRIKATAIQAGAVIRINGNIVTSGVFTDPIALNDGPTVINVNVTAQDGVTVYTYAFTVNRTGSSNALANVALNPTTTLTAAASGPGDVNYAATVAEGQSTIRVIPTVYDNATVTINGTAVTGGTASDPIALTAGGSTLITVVVTAENGTTTKTYTVNVSRPSSLLAVNKDGSKLLFANKTANKVAPAGDDGVVVHQGVSPNGDGSNDFLYIEGISAYTGNKLSIMNTSGALVFETKDYGKDGNHTFDGHSNKTGTLLKPGTYFYALEYQVEKQNKRKTGYIVIKY